MVMYLPTPAHCSLDLISEVVNERKRGRNAAFFSGVEAEWKTRVQAYIANQGSPEHVMLWPAITPIQKKSFHNLYLSPRQGTAQRAVLDALNDHELTCCPACGELGRPNTLDHYLPKGKYPHFSIVPVNLTPMCDRCQKEKGVKTHGPRAPRFFLHPYYDDFIQQQVIHIAIEPPFATPAFRIEFADWLTGEQRSVVAAHVRELAIEKRFSRYFKTESIRILKLTAMIRANGGPIAEMIEGFQIKAGYSSLNCWEHLYYSAVTSNPEMLDYLTNGPLPPAI